MYFLVKISIIPNMTISVDYCLVIWFLLNGMKIGLIESTEFIEDGSYKIKVGIKVGSDIKVPKDAILEIAPADLLGDMKIDIIMPATGLSAGIAQNNDLLDGRLNLGMVQTVTDQLMPLKDKIEGLVQSAGGLMGSMDSLVATGNLDAILASTEQTTKYLQTTSKSLNSLIQAEAQTLKDILNSTDKITKDLSTTTAQLDGLMADANNITGDLSSFSKKMNSIEVNEMAKKASTVLGEAQTTVDELNKILGDVNDSDGSIARLINDPKLYDNMQESIGSLNELLMDMKENPKDYVGFSIFERRRKKDKNK